jgi:3-oxoacyl-[acyl-carrier protein] reductase
MEVAKVLSGKKIIVTGASRGLGAAIALHIAECGAQVAISYSTKEEAALQVLKSLPGEGHICFQMDVSNEASVEAGLAHVLSQFTDVHGVVNNAGITKDTLLLRMKPQDFMQVIDANLKGTFLVTKFLTKTLMKNQGSIVNISSVIGQTGNAGQANYAASKAGLFGFTKSIASELASRGVRANCVAPGFISSDMTSTLSETVKNDILKNIPLRRIGTGQDVAFAVRFLLSDESKYITGHTLSVNGGLFMN